MERSKGMSHSPLAGSYSQSYPGPEMGEHVAPNAKSHCARPQMRKSSMLFSSRVTKRPGNVLVAARGWTATKVVSAAPVACHRVRCSFCVPPCALLLLRATGSGPPRTHPVPGPATHHKDRRRGWGLDFPV